jgi:phage-related protein
LRYRARTGYKEFCIGQRCKLPVEGIHQKPSLIRSWQGAINAQKAPYFEYINNDVAWTMDFSVEFYETATGRCPVREFLDELKASDPGDFATVLAGLAKLQHRRYHAEPLSRALGNGLFELRQVGKLNTRVLWFFMKGRRIIAVHAIRNKGQVIAARDLQTARERMADWQKRMK